MKVSGILEFGHAAVGHQVSTGVSSISSVSCVARPQGKLSWCDYMLLSVHVMPGNTSLCHQSNNIVAIWQIQLYSPYPIITHYNGDFSSDTYIIRILLLNIFISELFIHNTFYFLIATIMV